MGKGDCVKVKAGMALVLGVVLGLAAAATVLTPTPVQAMGCDPNNGCSHKCPLGSENCFAEGSPDCFQCAFLNSAVCWPYGTAVECVNTTSGSCVAWGICL